MIPRRLFRTVPTETTADVEDAWQHVCELHPDWTLITYRDPIDPERFPRTAHAWGRCTSGAQLAGLVRLEALWNHGGVYLDSDVELYRPLDRLCPLQAFAAWEDANTIPDAVLGAEAHHEAIALALELAVARLEQGAWASGPGVTTEVLRDRPDVLVLPPQSFYPYHYSERWRRGQDFSTGPWCFGVHHWAASWLTGVDT